MDFRLTSEQELLRRTVREFAEAEIAPFVREWDEAEAFAPALLGKLAGIGLTGIQVPDDLGGAGYQALDYCICIEELARVDPSVALSVAAHNGLAVSHLAMFGNAAQKTRYLGPLARGEMLGAWALTEAGSGSDAGALRTILRPKSSPLVRLSPEWSAAEKRSHPQQGELDELVGRKRLASARCITRLPYAKLFPGAS